jgi:hypothetical protein
MKLQYEVMLVVIFEPDYGFFVPTAGQLTCLKKNSSSKC